MPQSLRDGSYAMGATKSETIKRVVLPAALPGIVSAFMLAISRAIGETMIVVMAAGLAANLTFNPLAAVTTITVQIATLLVGDQEFDSAKTLSAFALGFVLFLLHPGPQLHRACASCRDTGNNMTDTFEHEATPTLHRQALPRRTAVQAYGAAALGVYRLVPRLLHRRYRASRPGPLSSSIASFSTVDRRCRHESDAKDPAAGAISKAW